ncbi:MAG: DUF4430 domain-containing protein [Bdellovibrionota bacterium]
MNKTLNTASWLTSRCLVFFLIASTAEIIISEKISAASLEVIGACASKPIFHFEASEVKGRSLGDLTVELFDNENIAYIGTSQGIHSINRLPNESETLEMISSSEMRAYGWCFELNGDLPEHYANEVILASDSDKIVWFFGFAHYLNGQWISQCEKSYLNPSDFLCSN